MKTDVHTNSLLAYWQGSLDFFNERENEILRVFRNFGPMTDREISIAGGFTHKSEVQPRISDLIDKGVLEETGTKLDPVSKKTVRIVAVKADPRRPQTEFSFTVEVERRAS